MSIFDRQAERTTVFQDIEGLLTLALNGGIPPEVRVAAAGAACAVVDAWLVEKHGLISVPAGPGAPPVVMMQPRDPTKYCAHGYFDPTRVCNNSWGAAHLSLPLGSDMGDSDAGHSAP